MNVVEHAQFDTKEDADLGILVEIAYHLVDGHSLEASALLGTNVSDKPAFGAYVGDIAYAGKRFDMATSTHELAGFAIDMDHALIAKN